MTIWLGASRRFREKSGGLCKPAGPPGASLHVSTILTRKGPCMKTLRRKLLIGGTAAAFVIGGAGVANYAMADDVDAAAGTGVSITVKGGKATFNSKTHRLTVKDTRSDGYGVRAVAEWTGPKETTVHAVGTGRKDMKTLNGRNNDEIWVKICYTKKGKNKKCSGEEHGYF